jgi:prevent-host-death family protein
MRVLSVYFKVYTMEAAIKTATAKELRTHASAILERVRKGDEVVITKRGKSVAIMKPILETEKPFSSAGFGIWKGRKEMSDVTKWVSERRKERHQR